MATAAPGHIDFSERIWRVMKGIFISYRREDTAGYAGRLYDRLAAHFGPDRVFMDVEGIEPGVDFVDALERAVGSCEVLIVLIGKDWLVADGAGKRRLDDPADFVRIETAAALARNIRVVPVLVDDAEMPRANQLPADMASLARRQALEFEPQAVGRHEQRADSDAREDSQRGEAGQWRNCLTRIGIVDRVARGSPIRCLGRLSGRTVAGQSPRLGGSPGLLRSWSRSLRSS